MGTEHAARRLIPTGHRQPCRTEPAITSYHATIAYDGTDFHGCARQPGLRTVQGALEDALAPHVGRVETFVAGRTDRGVHASGQVVSFTTDAEFDPTSVRRSLNRRLGPEIAVQDLAAAPDGFHARFSATGRSYTYLVVDGETPDPFLARTAWHLGRGLDVEMMDAAAGLLIGEHDFASFCRKARDRSTVRLVRRAEWSRRRPDLVAFDIEASSFCHQMVRSIVAACVRVGLGKAEPDAMIDMLGAGNRMATPGPAPPHGLTLVGVSYG